MVDFSLCQILKSPTVPTVFQDPPPRVSRPGIFFHLGCAPFLPVLASRFPFPPWSTRTCKSQDHDCLSRPAPAGALVSPPPPSSPVFPWLPKSADGRPQYFDSDSGLFGPLSPWFLVGADKPLVFSSGGSPKRASRTLHVRFFFLRFFPFLPMSSPPPVLNGVLVIGCS